MPTAAARQGYYTAITLSRFTTQTYRNPEFNTIGFVALVVLSCPGGEVQLAHCVPFARITFFL